MNQSEEKIEDYINSNQTMLDHTELSPHSWCYVKEGEIKK